MTVSRGFTRFESAQPISESRLSGFMGLFYLSEPILDLGTSFMKPPSEKTSINIKKGQFLFLWEGPP